MPICNKCECEFDVETAAGALMFGHPSTVKEAVPVWKAHLCQGCEAEIISDWKRPPIEHKSTQNIAKESYEKGMADVGER